MKLEYTYNKTESGSVEIKFNDGADNALIGVLNKIYPTVFGDTYTENLARMDLLTLRSILHELINNMIDVMRTHPSQEVIYVIPMNDIDKFDRGDIRRFIQSWRPYSASISIILMYAQKHISFIKDIISDIATSNSGDVFRGFLQMIDHAIKWSAKDCFDTSYVSKESGWKINDMSDIVIETSIIMYHMVITLLLDINFYTPSEYDYVN